MTWPNEDAIIERRRFLDRDDKREFSTEQAREDDEAGKQHLRHGDPGEQTTP